MEQIKGNNLFSSNNHLSRKLVRYKTILLWLKKQSNDTIMPYGVERSLDILI